MQLARGIVLLAGCAIILPPVNGKQPEREDRALLAAFERQLKDTAATAGPSIATIVVSRSELYPKVAGMGDVPGKLGGFDPASFPGADRSTERASLAQSLNLADVRKIPDHGYAGGVVIDPAGYVLTPYHVIDGATKIHVFLPGGGRSYADIHAADARCDLAVLKLITPPAKMTAIKFAEVRTHAIGDKKATVYPGKLCVLMANPYSSTFGLDKPSAAFGSITNVRSKAPRKLEDQGKDLLATRSTEYGPLLEYDLKFGDRTPGGLNADMTGGVLLNLDSEMIGLTNAAAVGFGDPLGPGYAMPADANFRKIVEVLRRGEEVEYGFLGVTGRAGQLGVVIDETTSRGPAAMAGLESNDEIKEVNGLPVRTFDDLLYHIGHALSGSKVTVTVSRFGRVRDFEVTLAKYKHDKPFIASVRPEPVFGMRVDHGSILSQQQPRKDERRIVVPAGVWVREVAAKSSAATQFKTLGDNPNRWLITKVNGTAVSTPADFYKAARGQETLKLTLLDPTETTPRERELTLP